MGFDKIAAAAGVFAQSAHPGQKVGQAIGLWRAGAVSHRHFCLCGVLFRGGDRAGLRGAGRFGSVPAAHRGAGVREHVGIFHLSRVHHVVFRARTGNYAGHAGAAVRHRRFARDGAVPGQFALCPDGDDSGDCALHSRRPAGRALLPDFCRLHAGRAAGSRGAGRDCGRAGRLCLVPLPRGKIRQHAAIGGGVAGRDVFLLHHQRQSRGHGVAGSGRGGRNAVARHFPHISLVGTVCAGGGARRCAGVSRLCGRFRAGICVVHGWRNKHESTAVGEFDDDDAQQERGHYEFSIYSCEEFIAVEFRGCLEDF